VVKAMIRHLFLILLVIAGGIGASQLPSFARAYEQRLGGALGEVQKLVDSFTTQAQAEGLDFDTLVERHRASPDVAIRATADRMTALSARRNALASEATALAAAPTSVDKLAVIATKGDNELLRDTFDTFEITATVDPAFGLAGVGIGWLIYGLVAGLFNRRSRRMTPGGLIKR
jgi:Sec-independent protein translocase protein TatA